MGTQGSLNFIHGKAEVDPNCEIGEGTRIWQFASVIRGARIGKNCSIASCAIVDGSEIGSGCIVSHGAFIDPGIKIGDFVFVGPGVKFCNDMWPRVSKDGFDMNRFFSGEVVTTRVEDRASIGAGAIILPGIKIGSGSLVAAGAVVTEDVPQRCIYMRDGSLRAIDPNRLPERIIEARA